jgi:hypothetical protein
MSAPRRIAVRALALWLVGAARVALAQAPAAPPGGETIDDPKVERRLGTRIDLPAAPLPATSVDGLVIADASAVPAPLGDTASGAAPAVSETIGPGPRAERRVPRVQIAYRRFTFAQVGAATSPGAGADEAFNVLSLDFYPISSKWRFGLSTQYGWEQGTFRANGDAFVAESLSLGGQIPGPVVTPFFEGHAGGGLMQRTHTGLSLNTIATGYVQLGVDVGLDVFLARHAFVSVALGYIHGTDGFVQENVFNSFSVDTWAFKLGFGL